MTFARPNMIYLRRAVPLARALSETVHRPTLRARQKLVRFAASRAYTSRGRGRSRRPNLSYFLHAAPRPIGARASAVPPGPASVRRSARRAPGRIVCRIMPRARALLAGPGAPLPPPASAPLSIQARQISKLILRDTHGLTLSRFPRPPL